MSLPDRRTKLNGRCHLRDNVCISDCTNETCHQSCCSHCVDNNKPTAILRKPSVTGVFHYSGSISQLIVSQCFNAGQGGRLMGCSTTATFTTSTWCHSQLKNSFVAKHYVPCIHCSCELWGMHSPEAANTSSHRIGAKVCNVSETHAQ